MRKLIFRLYVMLMSFIYVCVLFSFSSIVQAAESVPREKFIWVGKIHGQFNDVEYEQLAKFSIVVIANPHANYQLQPVHDAVDRLVEINPNIKVFPYWQTSKMNTAEEDEFISFGFQDTWYLRDLSGNKVMFRDGEKDYYIDLSNPDYRAWSITVIRSWLTQHPYAGVAFDNTQPITDPEIIQAIGTTKAEKWNNSRKQFIEAVKTQLPNKIILFNAGTLARGISSDQQSLLEVADMVLNEHFCYSGIHGAHQWPNLIDTAVAAQRAIANQGKTILQKTNFGQLGGTEKERVGRYCYGTFLLGYAIEKTYFKYGPSYFINMPNYGNELEENVKEIDIPLGNPAGPYSSSDDVYSRNFSNGRIYVNMSSDAKTISLPEPLIFMNGGITTFTYQTGQQVTIPPQDTLFFIKILPSSSSPSPMPNGGLNPANLIDYGDQPNDEINVFDYNVLVGDFGKTGNPNWINTDINIDGKVDISDFNILIENFDK